MRRPKQLQEAGMVAIIVTMIMIIVISLIVLGFSQVARRNQREALDRQLSSQAFYAAETGINDVIGKIRTGDYNYNDPSLGDYTNCSNSGNPNKNFMQVYGLSGQANLGPADANVAYTCLLVKPNLNPVQSQVTVGSNKVVHLLPSQPITAATSLTFTWDSTDTGNISGADAMNCPAVTGPGAANIFTPSDSWDNCPFGILRFDLFNAKDTSGNENSLTVAANTAGIYAVPANIASTNPVLFGQPNVVKAECSNYKCTATIHLTGVSLTDFYIRSTALYKPLGTLSISSTDDDVTFRGAGVQIDATGKAQDVLRRVQVQIPVTSNLSVDAPADALSTTDGICKRFTVAADGTVTPGLNKSSALCLP